MASLFILASVAAASLVLAQPAEAATIGPGYSYHGDQHSFLGGYLDPDGTVSYCIDAGKGSPAGGATTDQGVVSEVNGLSAQTMLELAYILAAHGNTSDDDTAAAMALTVWSIADPADHEARGGDGFVITRAPAAHRANILGLAADYRAEAAAYIHPIAPTARLSLSLTGDDPAHAVLDVTVTPVSVPWKLTLTDGVFADTGLPTREGVTADSRFEVDTTAPSGADDFLVSADGAATYLQYPESGAGVHLYTTPGAQSLAAVPGLGPLALSAHTELKVVVPPPVPPKLPRVAG